MRARSMHEADCSHFRSSLDVAARLYRMRLHELCSWTSSLERVRIRDEQLEIHLSPLEYGGDRALALARELARPDEPGSYYVVASLACRRGPFEPVLDVLHELEEVCGDPSTDERTAVSLRHAVGDALVRYLPLRRVEHVMQALQKATSHVVPVLARWLGSLGIVRVADALREALKRPSAEPCAVLRALGRTPGRLPAEVLEAIGSPDSVVAQTAAIVALRLGETSVLERLAALPPTPWAAVPMAMGGGLKRWPWLVEATRAEEPSQALLALGILGEPTGIEVLLEHLQVPEYAPAAAIGLFLLTEARLGERAASSARLEGPRVLAGDREWMALEGSEISTDPESWVRWLEGEGPRLPRGRRHRLGTRASKQGDLQVLSSSLPLWLRRCLADEVAIRYQALRWDYEPDQWVDAQHQAIALAWEELDDGLGGDGLGNWYCKGLVSAEMKPWSRKLREHGVNAR